MGEFKTFFGLDGGAGLVLSNFEKTDGRKLLGPVGGGRGFAFFFISATLARESWVGLGAGEEEKR